MSSLCAVIAYHSAEIYRVTVAVCYNKLAESIYFAACNAYAVGAVDTCVALVTLFAFFALSSLCAVIAYHSAEIHSCSVAVFYNKLTERIYFAACNAYAVGAVRAVFTVCTAKACVALFAFFALNALVALVTLFALNALVALCALYVSEIK